MSTYDDELWLALAAICTVPPVVLAGMTWGLVKLFKSRSAARLSGRVAAAGLPATSSSTGPPPFLSVLTLAVDVSSRQQLESAAMVPAHPDPLVARHTLARRLAQTLLGLEPAWQHFGYGERELGDLKAIRESFLRAVSDFRERSRADSDGGDLVVVTLILATRAPLLGVDRLDSSAAARDALQARVQVSAAQLLGVEVLITPDQGGLSVDAVLARFPEMRRLEASA